MVRDTILLKVQKILLDILVSQLSLVFIVKQIVMEKDSVKKANKIQTSNKRNIVSPTY